MFLLYLHLQPMNPTLFLMVLLLDHLVLEIVADL